MLPHLAMKEHPCCAYSNLIKSHALGKSHIHFIVILHHIRMGGLSKSMQLNWSEFTTSTKHSNTYVHALHTIVAKHVTSVLFFSTDNFDQTVGLTQATHSYGLLQVVRVVRVRVRDKWPGYEAR